MVCLIFVYCVLGLAFYYEKYCLMNNFVSNSEDAAIKTEFYCYSSVRWDNSRDSVLNVDTATTQVYDLTILLSDVFAIR